LISAFKELIERELRIAQGTIIGAQKSFETKASLSIANIMLILLRRSFCLLNDQAIASQFY
jgi:hypothetical protein